MAPPKQTFITGGKKEECKERQLLSVHERSNRSGGIDSVGVHFCMNVRSAFISDKTWGNYLLKTIEVGEFDIIEVPLEEGDYTVLLEFNRGLYPHSRLVEGHYPYIIITKGR